jgi:hypothetical protein
MRRDGQDGQGYLVLQRCFMNLTSPRQGETSGCGCRSRLLDIENMSNNLSRRADNGDFPTCGLSEGFNNPSS